MKIAMLNCLKSNEVCTGASCFKAYNERIRSFEQYKDQEVELAAFMRCNGCDKDPDEDRGMKEKIGRLKNEGVEVIHVGVCTKNREGVRCKTIEKVMAMFEAEGIRIVDGTH